MYVTINSTYNEAFCFVADRKLCIIMPPDYSGGSKWCCNPSVHLSVCRMHYVVPSSTGTHWIAIDGKREHIISLCSTL